MCSAVEPRASKSDQKPPFSWAKAAALEARPLFVIVSTFPVVFYLNDAAGFAAAATKTCGRSFNSCLNLHVQLFCVFILLYDHIPPLYSAVGDHVRQLIKVFFKGALYYDHSSDGRASLIPRCHSVWSSSSVPPWFWITSGFSWRRAGVAFCKSPSPLLFTRKLACLWLMIIDKTRHLKITRQTSRGWKTVSIYAAVTSFL